MAVCNQQQRVLMVVTSVRFLPLFVDWPYNLCAVDQTTTTPPQLHCLLAISPWTSWTSHKQGA